MDAIRCLRGRANKWRDYRARYWDGTLVGDWSAVLRVSVGYKTESPWKTSGAV